MDLDPTITPNPKAWFNVPDAWKDVPGVFTAAFEASKAMKDITNKSLSSWCSLSKLSSYVDVIVTQGLDKSHWDYQWNYPPCCGPCFVDAQTAELIFFPTKGVKDGQGIVSGDYTL